MGVLEDLDVGVGAVGPYRIRPPVKPVTVGELAGLEGTGSGPADRRSTPTSHLAKSSDPLVEHLPVIHDAGDDASFNRGPSVREMPRAERVASNRGTTS